MKRKKTVSRILAAIAICIFFVLGAHGYISKLKVTMLEDMHNNLSRTVESNADLIEECITSEIHTVSSIASLLARYETTNEKELVNYANSALKDTPFLRFGVANTEGICYTNDHEKFDISNRSYFQSALQGETVFSNTFIGEIKKEYINVIAAPIYHGDKITNVFFATIQTNVLADKLLFEIYDAQGFSEMVDASGKIILKSESKIKKQNIKSLSELQFVDNFDVKDMKKQKNGVVEFVIEKEHRYLAFHKLNLNDWYVISVVPSNVVSEQSNYFLTMTMITWIVLFIIFAGIIGYIYMVKTKSDKEMEKLAFYDDVTLHYNYNRFRILFQDYLDQNIANEFTLIELDMKDFKLYNELYGYRHGDRLLRTIMKVCQYHCKKEELCARITADRFLLLLHTHDQELIKQRMNRMIDEIKQDQAKEYCLFKLIFKVGVYLIEQKDTDFSKCHDRCTYAKKQIRETAETFSFFSKEMYEHQLGEKRLESMVENAFEQKEFQVYLQPKISLKDFKIHGAEALVRWISPTIGLISPNEFIPMLERNGQLERLDMYMLEEVCKILESWKYAPICISVNLSKVYLFQPGFVDRLIEIVNQYGISPQYLEFEITESVIFDHSEELQEIIKRLQNDGFSVAMDDFGSGYSSLNMLKDIPIDVMKLDQAFFQFANHNQQRSKKIIENVISLAKGLKIRTVAEGVEHKEEVTFLSDVGCDEIQGFYYSKPVNYDEFVTFYQSFEKAKPGQ